MTNDELFMVATLKIIKKLNQKIIKKTRKTPLVTAEVLRPNVLSFRSCV